MASVEEESLDLSTCCVCLEPYDNGLRKPKFLPCAHTNCLQCVKAMAPAPAMQLTCPVCKMVCDLPANVESLPTNLHAMHIIQLNKIVEDKNKLIAEKIGKNWCETCERLAKPTCQQQDHKLTDFVADASKVESQLVKVSNQLNEAVANREESQDHLKEDRDWLKAKLEVTEAKMEENSDWLSKLREAIDVCEGMKELSQANKAAASTKIKLDKMLIEAKVELKEAQQFLNYVVAEKLQKKQIALSDKDNQITKVTAASYSPNLSRSIKASGGFAATCFAVHRKKMDHSRKFNCRDLTGHGGSIAAIEFSDDGTLLASGGWDKILRLWPISKAVHGQNVIIPIKMETKHESYVRCLIVSPDNVRLFSGENLGKVFIHDVATTKLMNSVVDLKCVWNMSLKPGSDGNVFAVVCGDNILRIFDIRSSTSQPVLQTEVQQPFINLVSIMFSPVQSNLIAAAGTGGTRLFDIRHNQIGSRHLYQNACTNTAMFDGKGTHLLCKERIGIADTHQIIVHKVPSSEQQQAEFGDGLKLTSPGYAVPPLGLNTCCFAGDDDDLVVAASADNSLHVWSVLDGPNGNPSFNQSLLSLRGHQKGLNSLRYCKAISSLASCGIENVIKLWSPSSN